VASDSTGAGTTCPNPEPHHSPVAGSDSGAARGAADPAPDIAGIVERAAAILQEELSAGTLSARNLPSSLLDAVASGMSSLGGRPASRQDAHLLLDRLLGTLAAGSAPVPADSNASEHRAAEPAASTPAIVVSGSARAGETATFTVTLANDDPVEAGEVRIACTDLIAGSGGRIPSARVALPAEPVLIAPLSTRDIPIRVRVPGGALPGTYHGLLHAASLNDAWSVVRLRVE
jgi:hypothetical protein